MRWCSVRARGPVSIVALGRSDLEALSHNFPLMANKVLTKLAEITSLRLQMLVEELTSEQNKSVWAGRDRKPRNGEARWAPRFY